MLIRWDWDPFREFDRLASQLFGGDGARMLPMDAYRQGDRFMVHFDLPGVDPASVEVTVEKNVLTVSARRELTRSEDQEWLVSERPSGTFTRRLHLGEGLDAEHIEARYDNGVLTLAIPVAEEAKPKKVAITTAPAPKAIEAQAA
jgi:HSP20 family protein